MSARCLRGAFACAALVCVPLDALAQGAFTFREPAAGDCRIVVEMPDRSTQLTSLVVNGGTIAIDAAVRLDDGAMLVPLRSPLLRQDQLEARNSAGGQATSAVGRGLAGAIVCAGATQKFTADDREDFEASGFLGVAVDNFAPKRVAGYPETEGDVRTRRTFGVIAQYRAFGQQGGKVQLWALGATLNGMRSADIDCREPEQAVLCKNGRPGTAPGATGVQDQSIVILEHASSLEVHIGARVEFFTLQHKSNTPARIYAFYRHGFIDLAGEPTVFSTDQFGLGAVLPSGPFRHSGVSWGFGENRLFGTHLGWNRSKVAAALMFDLTPTLNNPLGAFRGFVAIDVDRQFKAEGVGPDSVQSYFGLMFDFRKAFHP